MPEKTRTEWVDVYKGVLIVLVLFGHLSSPFNGLIYLFHMSAFFFISGYTSSFSKDLKAFIIQRAVRLILPYFSVNLCFFALRYLLKLANLEHFFYPDSISPAQLSAFFHSKITLDLGGASWFLPVLFYSSVCAMLLYRLSQKLFLGFWLLPIISFGMIHYAYWLYSQQGNYPYDLDLALVGTFYIAAGYTLAQLYRSGQRINHAYAMPTALIVYFFCTKLNYCGVNWPTRSFSYYLIANLLPAFSAFYLFGLISIAISKTPILKELFIFLGQKTMPIFLFHFLAFRLLYAVMWKAHLVPLEQLQALVPPAGNHYWFIMTILSIVICLTIDYLLSFSPHLHRLLTGQ